MDDFVSHKKQVDKKLVETVISALEKGDLTDRELPEVASFILEKGGTVKTHNDLTAFLQSLVSRWEFFSPVLILEKAETEQVDKEKALESAARLTKENRIEEAVAVARAAAEST